MRSIALLMLVTALVGPIASSSAAPPTEVEIRGKMQALYAYWQENQESEDAEAGLKAKATELMADVDVDACGVMEILNLSQMLYYADAARAKAEKRLATLAADQGADGAEASVASLILQGRSAEEGDAKAMGAGIEAALAHPGMPALMKTPRGMLVFNAVEMADAETLNAHPKAIVGLANMVDDTAPPMTLAAASGLAVKMTEIKSVDAATRNAFRKRLIGLLEAAAEKDASAADRLMGQVAFLKGAYARGELMDHVAPPLTISWSDPMGDPVSSLESLRGKVVVVDFWATWCGPCVASFPQMRELQAHYADSDVVILGVTSLQGRHYPGDGPAIDCTDDPAREQELMAEFMKAKDITWRVVFSEQEVFNPDFGVQGIPHVAVLDSAGKVRHNGLHPMMPKEEKYAIIDALLKEAGKPVPAAVVEAETTEG